MILPDALERVIEKETFAEILACLTPTELLMATLRLEGLSDAEIGGLLGISRQAVRQRLVRAQARIIHTKPTLAPSLRGRRLSNGKAKSRPTPAFEQSRL